MEDILVIILLVVMMTAGMVLFFGGWLGWLSTGIARCVAHSCQQAGTIPRASRLRRSQFIRTKIHRIQGLTGLGRLVMEIP